MIVYYSHGRTQTCGYEGNKLIVICRECHTFEYVITFEHVSFTLKKNSEDIFEVLANFTKYWIIFMTYWNVELWLFFLLLFFYSFQCLTFKFNKVSWLEVVMDASKIFESTGIHTRLLNIFINIGIVELKMIAHYLNHILMLITFYLRICIININW